MGPFDSYSPPGVYTRTLLDPSVASLLGELRLPVLIGVGEEQLRNEGYEMVRGSSAIADNLKSNEDVSSQLDGLESSFQTSNFPITDGSGMGRITNNPNDISVTVNGNPIGVRQVVGAKGKVFLNQIPLSTDIVKISYYYKKSDTLIEEEDLTVQVNGIRKDFKVNHLPIVDGSNGGWITTDVSKIIVKVDGNMVIPKAVDGATGTFTLATPPNNGSELTISYYTNKHQDTSDALPHLDVSEILSVGYSPGRTDFIAGTDFALIGDTIHWGHSFRLTSHLNTPKTEYFDDTQISGLLVPNRKYMEEAEGDSDGDNTFFTVKSQITDGEGNGIVTHNPNLIRVYVGSSVTDAFAKGEVPVLKVNGTNRTVELKTAPSSGEKVYVTYYYNLLNDDTYIIKNVFAGGTGDGEYTLESTNMGKISVITEGTHSVSSSSFSGIVWPNSFSDIQGVPGYSKTETITVTFTSPTEYVVTSNLGVNGTNGNGNLNQTFMSDKTGIRFTILNPADASWVLNPYQFTATDTLEFNVNQDGAFKTNQVPNIQIPGIRIIVTDTVDVGDGDTALLETFNKAGNEPDVGSFYYVSYKYNKTDYDTHIYTKFKDVEAAMGRLNTNNHLTLGAYLAFLNGAVAVGLKQVLRDPDTGYATTPTFIDAIKELEAPFDGNFKPDLLVPLTTDLDVIAYMNQHCLTQSSIRYRSERVGVFGYAIGTSPERAREVAMALKSDVMVGLYPDGAKVSLLDEYGRANEFTVDGSFIASAYSGLDVTPAYDVATPLTRKQITGFTGLLRHLDPVIQNQVATAGITIIEDLDPVMRIRHSLTTDPTNVITRSPSITKVKFYVQQVMRQNLDQYIGVKFLPRVLRSIEDTMRAAFQQLQAAEIIVQYTGVSAVQDPSDPAIARVEGYYSPVFPLEWIVVTLNLRTKL